MKNKKKLMVVMMVAGLLLSAGTMAPLAELAYEAKAPTWDELPLLDLDNLTSLHAEKSILDNLTGYDTIEEAAVHAIERAYKCSHSYECGGVIAQRDSDGKYVVGPVRSDDAGDHVAIDEGVPAGGHAVATYHTHPCLKDSHYIQYFSPADMIGSIVTHEIGFMGELCTGKVHEFDPLTMLPPNDEVEPGLYLTEGKIVGQIAVDGKTAEPNQGNL